MQPHTDTGHPRRWAILGVLVISLLVVVLDNTVLNVALKAIADPAHGLGATQSQLEWAINSYTLVFAGLLFTWGVLGDRAGRKRILLLGMVLFGLASLISAYAQTPTQLIWARALMGIGGAAVMPSTLSIISNVFDPRERAKAIGMWAGAVGLAVAIGPVVGGFLLEHFWWGSVFLINVPIVLAGLVLITLLVPESRDPKPGRIDLVGVVLSIAGLVAFVYGIIDGGEHGFGRFQSWGPIVAGVLILAGFVAFELRSDHPSLDVRLFRNPRFSAAVGSVGLVFFAAMGTMFFLAFYLQLVRGFTALEAGLMMTPFAVAQLVFAPRSAAMVRRFGPKLVCAVGLALVTLTLTVYLFVTATTPVWVLLLLAFVQGVGMANVMPPATESVMSSLPREKAGVGSAVSNTIRQIGGALGVAVLGSLLAAVYRDEISGAVDALPAGARDAAAESITGAYGVAAQAGPAGAQLIEAANSSFVTAMHWAAGGSAIVGLIGIGVVLAWLPRHSAPHAPRTATPEPRELAEVG
ncbi:MFS transporter [Luedemannella helvata]|uniref:MFS transporter n=1 Tax=Luedemannella helvata TaxID=349315 RepID=A0ABP4WGS0_9ACTN